MINSLSDVILAVEKNHLLPTRRRDLISAVNRIAEMAQVTPGFVPAQPANLRDMVRKIRPALHGVSEKTWANLRSSFVAALELAGVIDTMGRGSARADPGWGPLMALIARDKRRYCGLASFANWCASTGVAPGAVNDATVGRFLSWLEARTLSPRPHDTTRQVPIIWNEVRKVVKGWPRVELSPVSYRAPAKRAAWAELTDEFRKDAEAYLTMRAKPDVFDERAGTPSRALAPATIRLQRQHLQSAVAALTAAGTPLNQITSLSDLVSPEPFKVVLRHFHAAAGGKPNAFTVGLSMTLRQVAKYRVQTGSEVLDQLKRIAAKLPPVAFDLTEKNKALMGQLESVNLRARLLYLPHGLIEEVMGDLARGRLRYVWAQVAVAIDVLLAAPIRAQNLSVLHWTKHFSEPDGAKGRLILNIPAQETKTGKKDYVAEIPPDVAQRLQWYRAQIIPRLGGDPQGPLFISIGGDLKTQQTLTVQIIKTIADRVGVHMTPHQFRHLAATLYLEDKPEDFETARSLLGHAWSKTTHVYAGSSSRRASRAYGSFLFKQREDLKVLGTRKTRRKSTRRGNKKENAK